MWAQIKANPWRYVIIGIAALIVGVVLLLIVSGLVNSYKESQFLKRQAEYQKQIEEATQRANIAQAEADRTKAESKQKDVQIAQLQNEKQALQEEVGQKRVVYINSRKPVTLRPVGSGVSDAELISDAKRLGIIIR